MTTKLLIVCPNLSSAVYAVPEEMKVSVHRESNKEGEAVLIAYTKDVLEIQAIIQDYGGYAYCVKDK